MECKSTEGCFSTIYCYLGIKLSIKDFVFNEKHSSRGDVKNSCSEILDILREILDVVLFGKELRQCNFLINFQHFLNIYSLKQVLTTVSISMLVHCKFE